MFQRILVPVDLTERSLAAVDLAYEMATQSNAEVTLLHVIETIEHVQFDELKPFYERLEKSAREGMLQFAEKFVANKLRIDNRSSTGTGPEKLWSMRREIRSM